MKKTIVFLITAFSLSIGLLSLANAEKPAGTLGKACPNVVGIQGYIYKNYQPLRRSPHDRTLVGYAKSPTLLVNGGGSRRGKATIYDAKGKRLASCQGLPCDECKNHWRFKCSAKTGHIRKAAIRASSTPKVYFNVGGKCVEVADAGRCYGSVKGLCNQILK